MSANFKYINETDRNIIRAAKKVLKRLKKRFVKLDTKDSESLFGQNEERKHYYRFALWRMCDELDWVGISVYDDTNELSITV